MAKQNKNAGFQQAAGLIRYFDAEEDSAFKISPTAVLVFSAVIGVGAIMLRVFWKYN